MPKVSKKRRFRGQNQWDAARSKSSNSSARASTPVPQTASFRKITDQKSKRNQDFDGAYSYRLIELSNLVRAFQP